MAFLALNMVFRKFPFSQVKLHLNTHNIHLGQHALGPSCYIVYGCANFWCRKPTSVERMYNQTEPWKILQHGDQLEGELTEELRIYPSFGVKTYIAKEIIPCSTNTDNAQRSGYVNRSGILNFLANTMFIQCCYALRCVD